MTHSSNSQSWEDWIVLLVSRLLARSGVINAFNAARAVSVNKWCAISIDVNQKKLAIGLLNC